MINAKMFFESHINQAVVTAPAVTVNYALEAYFSLYYCLQRLFLAIRHYFSVYSTVSLIYAKYRLFECASSALKLAFLTTHSLRTKITFIYFYFANKLIEFLDLMPGDRLPEQIVISIYRVPVKVHKMSSFRRWDVNTKVLHNIFNLIMAQFAVFMHVSVYHFLFFLCKSLIYYLLFCYTIWCSTVYVTFTYIYNDECTVQVSLMELIWYTK